ncbi:MAG: O-antigen ligase family protein [Tepidimonas sp.]|uniref:O-antigen ligase family protein n=1 Tax=Tepidimonas sp. TaxID=2002775 RepID=UPI00298F0C36|nr:O-antigen ligase family protein [Tepidimonas sp.]MDW8336827.1 O-antigen ligase family protein [Tepidimonas sp.]
MLVPVASFLVPALSLALPSGYSWGALVLVVAGAISLRDSLTAFRIRGPVAWRALLATVALMGLVWLMRLDLQWDAPRLSDFDRFAKYGLALVAALALLRQPASLTWALRGCWVGAWLAAAVAAWQIHGLGLERAHGHTNAIQFGNVAVLLSLWSVLAAWHARQLWERILASGGVLMGALAALLSGSRGGWWVLLALASLLGWAWWRHLRASRRDASLRIVSRAVGVLALIVGLVWSTAGTVLQDRLRNLNQDLVSYTQGHFNTSIGQRLVHWQLAWSIGLERPWLGWGQSGYEQRKREWVEAGRAPAVVLQFGHAHHEWLDLWAKAGAVGVIALALFYAVPARLYLRQLRAATAKPASHEATLAAWAGLVLVLGYVGFGLSQAMFAHNSGNVMYLFMNLLWFSVAMHRTPAHTHA